MDLFTPIVPSEKWHPNFANVIKMESQHNLTVLQRWAEGFVDRDGKFVREFQTTFNSSFWELYLFALLKEIGCSVDFTFNSPDFVVTTPTPLILEATIASNAEGATPEHESFFRSKLPSDLNEFNHSAILRLANSISAKSKKYLQSYSNLDHVKGKPFVLAVTPFDRPFAYLQVHRAIDAVLYGYYVDEQSFLANPVPGGHPTVMHLQSVRKNESVSIPVGLFNDDSHSHISAVIFNPCATWGKVRALAADPNPCVFFNAVRSDPRNGDEWVFSGPKNSYEESLLAGLRIYHNPHAMHPLDLSVFMNPDVFQGMSVNPSAGEWLLWCDRAPLVNRTVQTFNLHDKAKMEEALLKFSATNGKWKRFQNGRVID
jgi:hypothetical protein